ncbi:MAG: hypothetical protein ACI4RD_03805 [Kiritimatiellia bacterium]
MALSLQPRQTQKQALTPAMWLGLNLLTLPIGELRDSVKQEIDSNPALEVENPSVFAGTSPGRLAPGDGFALDNVADERGESLEEHLLAEIRLSELEPREAELCRVIVAELDGDGRFQGKLPDLQMLTGASAAALEAARQRVMTLDPKGCGARNLKECFLAQLDRVPAAKRAAFVADLENLESGRVLPETVKILRTLDPFPGRLYDNRKTQFVTPDIQVDEDGEVELDQRDIPELRVSPKYVDMAKDRTLDAETRQFAAERVKRAREFREAVLRRQETMERIAELAIAGQPDFLTMGARGIRKQTMSEVAKQAKCNVATVSRAAARKYVKTPRGTVPFRKFFALVDQAPVEKLREVLEAIPPGQFVPDREIAARMAKAGFPMARRTVAKYRLRLMGGRQ